MLISTSEPARTDTDKEKGACNRPKYKIMGSKMSGVKMKKLRPITTCFFQSYSADMKPEPSFHSSQVQNLEPVECASSPSWSRTSCASDVQFLSPSQHPALRP